MAKEYINREAALQVFCEANCDAVEHCPYRCDDYKAIMAIPAADVAPVVHGQWSIWDFAGTVQCSVCGELSGESNYCPNCGARMDGGAEDG